MEWLLTKNVKRLKLIPGRVPHRFECQNRSNHSPIERKGAKKRKHTALVEEALKPVPSTSTCHIESTNINLKDDKSVQVSIKKSFRSKGTSTAFQMTSVACSPIKMDEKSLYQSFLNESFAQREAINFEQEDNGSDFECPAEESSSEDEHKAAENYKQHMLVGTVLSIEKNPKLFLGLSPSSFFLIKLLCEEAPLPTNHIYLALKKIRLNLPFSILALDFGLSVSTSSRVFSKALPVLAKKMQDLISWPHKKSICAHLPIPFRARYAKVQSIIDCLEIEIEKPSNPMHQSLTWSNYYNCNTIKYLVSCLPDGLITYISEGYGGRSSDFTIVEDSGYLNKLSPGALVMADRGFKNISFLLEQRGCSLIRPPSVSASRVSTKEEVKQSKRIAALRIHVERVIGRLRDFSMLMPHACIDIHLVPLLDYAIIIACGIVNLQDHLLKKQL